MASETLEIKDKVSGPVGKMVGALDRLISKVTKADKAMGKLGAKTSSQGIKQEKTWQKVFEGNRFRRMALARKASKAEAEAAEKGAEAMKGFGAETLAVAGVGLALVGTAAVEVTKKVTEIGVAFGAAVTKAALLRSEAERTAQALAQREGVDALKAIDGLTAKLGVGLKEGRAQWVKFMQATNSDSKLSAALIKLRADIVATTGSADMADAAVEKVLNAPPGKAAETFRKVAHAAGVAGNGVAAAEHKMSTFDGLVKRIGDAPARIFDGLAKSAGPKLDDVGKKANAALNAFLKGPTAAKAFEMVSAGIDKVIGAIEFAIPLVEPFIAGFIAGVEPLGPILDKIGEAIGKAFGDDKTSKMSTAEKIGKAVGIAFTLIGAAILSVVQIASISADLLLLPFKGAAKIGEWIGKGVVAAKAKLQELASAGSTIATNLIDGLKNGITAGVDKVVAAAKKLGDAIPAEIKKVLGIASPSKVMMRFGGYTAEGLARGMDGGSDKVSGSAADLGDAVVSGATSPVAAASPSISSRQSVTVNVNVSAQPGATRQDGEALASGLAPQLRRELERLLSGYGMELAP